MCRGSFSYLEYAFGLWSAWGGLSHPEESIVIQYLNGKCPWHLLVHFTLSVSNIILEWKINRNLNMHGARMWSYYFYPRYPDIRNQIITKFDTKASPSKLCTNYAFHRAYSCWWVTWHKPMLFPCSSYAARLNTWKAWCRAQALSILKVSSGRVHNCRIISDQYSLCVNGMVILLMSVQYKSS